MARFRAGSEIIGGMPWASQEKQADSGRKNRARIARAAGWIRAGAVQPA